MHGRRFAAGATFVERRHATVDGNGRTSETTTAYIEDVAVFFERSGMSRMSGRLLGALMIADPPELAQEELAAILGVSRGAVSQASRMLVDAHLVERRRRPGERRDYYRIRPDAWTDMIERRVDAIVALRRLAERGVEVLDAAESPGQQALVGLIDVCRFFEVEWPGLVARWRSERVAAGQGSRLVSEESIQ